MSSTFRVQLTNNLLLMVNKFIRFFDLFIMQCLNDVIAPKTLNYLASQSFDFQRHVMKVIPETRRYL